MQELLPDSIIFPLRVLWLGRQGPGLTKEEIDFLSNSPLPGEPNFNSAGVAALRPTTALFAQSATDYLKSAGLISSHANGSHEKYKLSRQGAAVAQAIATKHTDDVAHLVIGPDDPVAYFGLLSNVVDYPDLLIIDPYLHPNDLIQVAAAVEAFTVITKDTHVSSVPKFGKQQLTKKARRAAFVDIIGSWPQDSERSLVYVSPNKLHDRFFLGTDGRGYVVGGSFRSAKLTIALELPTDYAMERHKEFVELLATGEHIRQPSR